MRFVILYIPITQIPPLWMAHNFYKVLVELLYWCAFKIWVATLKTSPMQAQVCGNLLPKFCSMPVNKYGYVLTVFPVLNLARTPFPPILSQLWWARLDSNQRRYNREIYSLLPLPLGDWPILAPQKRLELLTYRLEGGCSNSYWATGAYNWQPKPFCR